MVLYISFTKVLVYYSFLITIVDSCLFQRAGAVFPQRSERSAPVFTPPQTQPLTSYPPNLRNAGGPSNDVPDPSAEPDFPTLR